MDDLNLKNRKNLVTSVPLNPDFKQMVAEIEQEYPGFTVIEREYNPGRVRLLNKIEHYEFYLERQ